MSASKKENIVVIGSSNTDMIIKSDHLPAPGETILGGEFLMAQGGKGANQAVAAARLGGEVSFIAKTGNDIFGNQSIKSLNNEHINTDFVQRDETRPSGIALISVDSKGENSIVVASGSNMSLSPSDIDIASDLIKNAGFVLMQLEIPLETVEYVTNICFENRVQVILNPAPAQKLSDKLLQSLSIITPNETEAALLTGIAITDISDIENAAAVLKQKGVGIVIVTMGSAGAYVLSDTISTIIPASEVKAVDTTAAGDTFNGALCLALSSGKGIEEAVGFANKAASISVTKMGAQPSIPYLKEI
ncbi:MAG: ribokinase [Bacteroidetes bacterium]|nr:MAG: ribokinase [Bacteroidota bacterium]